MPPSESPRATHSPRRAVIDVGTNSVKLLVAEVAGGVKPVHEASRVTRLGRGFYETHQLQPEAIRVTAECVRDYAGLAREWGAVSLRVIATSAARDARNAAELTSALSLASGVATEIITGDQEADLVFRGVTTDARLAGAPLLIMDVGGGSTEFIVGEDGRCQFRRSYQLGVVRELERSRPSDPPAATELAACRDHIRSFLSEGIASDVGAELARHDPAKTVFVGVGGTATVLAAMELALPEFDRERLEGCVVPRESVTRRTEQLWSLAHAARERIPGLPPKRADVILAGAVIYEAVMAVFGFASFRVNTRGLRYAAILEAP